MKRRNRQLANRVLAAMSIAAMAGCTLDSTGLGSPGGAPDASLVDASQDAMLPPPDAQQDAGKADVSDAATDPQVPDGASADVELPDTTGADANTEDALEAGEPDVLDASEEDALDAAPDDVMEAGEVADVEADAPEPPDAPVPVVDSMTVANESLSVDRVRTGDGSISADGLMDGAFVVSVYGEIVGLAMISTDAAGAPFGGQQWDTYVGAATIPSGIGTGYQVGSSTWQLGVWEGSTPLNASDGSLMTVPLGAHTLQLYGANSGWFVSGRYFRVAVELAGGQIIWSPVLTY